MVRLPKLVYLGPPRKADLELVCREAGVPKPLQARSWHHLPEMARAALCQHNLSMFPHLHGLVCATGTTVMIWLTDKDDLSTVLYLDFFSLSHTRPRYCISVV